MREGSGVTRVEHEIVIGGPVEKVFAFVVDPANVPAWQPAVLEMRAVGPIGVGQRVTQTRRLLGRRIALVVEVCEFVPNERFGLRIASGPAPGVLRASFSPTPGGTRLRLVAELPGGGLRRFANPVLAEAARAELVANCDRLRTMFGARDGRSREAADRP